MTPFWYDFADIIYTESEQSLEHFSDDNWGLIWFYVHAKPATVELWIFYHTNWCFFYISTTADLPKLTHQLPQSFILRPLQLLLTGNKYCTTHQVIVRC